MDPELQDQIDRMSAEISTSVTAAVNEHVTNVVTAAEMRLVKTFADAEKRLSERARINAEAVRASARAIADGYGGTLEAIERRLEKMNRDFSENFRDHDGVLITHARRISALERKRS
jgi:regulator of PEP synthase PpsR (kinase-PPPase family)